MSKANNTPSWFSSWRTARESSFDDPADLGTAFGLDMSMDSALHEPPPAPSEPETGWAQRLGLRRKPA